ncbi:DUF4328 domain-containing protein [Nocardia paucivorans]|uniref:DUF4328 domain-containing protein n=1 Tax=Nocardia paucivorans TaxID=114259 RepID=UPI001FDF58E7|nr:DUF4328 domain-containing protein [Nocardia paucivorans]
MHWCPRCRGVLLSPGPIDAPPEHRNYRWVARRPGQLARRPVVPRRRPVRPTPRYTEIPRWGLRDEPPRPQPTRRRPLRALADRVYGLLAAVAVLYALAAGAELGRYLILLRNRTRLIEPWLLAVSDALVIGASLIALILALPAAVGALGWLIELRRVEYARRKRSDPRSVRMLALGCLIPVVNLLWPGVFLTEVVSEPRAVQAVRIWWSAWVFGGALSVAALMWRFADSLQAEADGVLFTALTDAVAAAVAVLTLWAVRMVEGRDLRGRSRTAQRWVVATDPAVPVIEPVQPGSAATVSTAEPAGDPAVPDDRRTGSGNAEAVDAESVDTEGARILADHAPKEVVIK